MNRYWSFALALLLCLAPARAETQLPAPKKIEKGTRVVLRLPMSLGEQTGGSYTYSIEQKDGVLTIRGRPLIGAIGINDGDVYNTVRSGNWSGKRHFLSLENERRNVVHLHIPAPDEETAARILNIVLAPASEGESVGDSLATITADAFFASDLKEMLSIDLRRMAVRQMARGTAPIGSFSVSSDSAGRAVDINLGFDDVVYNDLQVSTNERASRAIEDDIVPALSAYMPVLRGLPESVSTLTLTLGLTHRRFSDPASKNENEFLEVRIPRERVLDFLDTKVTAQELVDSGRVLLKGALVKPRLDR